MRLDFHARGSESTNNPYSLMSGSLTQMPNRIRTSNCNRSIVCMRIKKENVCIQGFSTFELGIFTPLVFTTTGGMGRECHKYHSRLAELIAIKKGKTYAKTMSWVRSRISFALLRPVFICLRGSRAKRRAMYHDIRNADMKIKKAPFRDREDMVYIFF